MKKVIIVDGEKYLLEKPLCADVTLIRGSVGDKAPGFTPVIAGSEDHPPGITIDVIAATKAQKS